MAIKRFIHSSCSPTSHETRQKCVKKILSSSFSFDEEDHLKIWKGLFYCIWYSEVDAYEELVYEICYNSKIQNMAEFLFAGFCILAQEWQGIDHLRIDKFYSLARHLLNRTLRYVVHDNPDERELLDSVFDSIEPCAELLCHVNEVFLEEANNVMMRKVIWDPREKADTYFLLIKPLIVAMARSEDFRVMDSIKEYTFDELKKDIFPRESEEVRSILYPLLVKCILDVCKDSAIKPKNRRVLLHIGQGLKS